MGQIKWAFLFLAIIAAVCMVCIGISIGQESLLGFLISLAVLIIVMWIGFRKKKKMNESGNL